MLTLDLPEPLERKLAEAAQRRGRPVAEIAEEALIEFLEDEFDRRIVLERLAANEPTIPLEEVEARYADELRRAGD